MATSVRTKVIAACAAMLTVTATAVSAVTATSAAARPDPLARFHGQHLDWRACALGADDELGRSLDAAGADCADVTVPLDYTDPGGRTITVALSRLKANDTAHRIGPLLLNDGGPAGPGLHMPLTTSEVMGDVADRYDLIGMDPRFVGRSTPLDCGWDLGSALLRSAGADRAAYRDEVAVARELAARCERAHGDVLPYVTTRNTARDMDVIRAALREDALSYLGYSYGGYLGQVYTQLFPGRTDRMVLDGVNPRGATPRTCCVAPRRPTRRPCAPGRRGPPHATARTGSAPRAPRSWRRSGTSSTPPHRSRCGSGRPTSSTSTSSPPSSSAASAATSTETAPPWPRRSASWRAPPTGSRSSRPRRLPGNWSSC